MERRDVLKWGLATTLAGSVLPGYAEEKKPEFAKATYSKLPRWRGFNLLEKFNGRNERFKEDDFRWIRDFGFDFVRLPMDYRMWIKDNDWRKIDEKVLEEIDEALRFGEKYGIHVKINFHRAPGYTVAHPPEPKSVWTDPEALEVCTLHWKTFAKRYKGISSDRLSFNLFNEPAVAEDMMDRCVAAHKAIIKGIRDEDSDRLIICDGCQWGSMPFFDLVDQKVAQATRGYSPMEISHYKASWVNSKDFPEPTWPMVSGNGLLVSPGKEGLRDEAKKPLGIEGFFPKKTKLRIRVGTVSTAASFVVTADGKTIFEHRFKPGPGEGEWKESVFKKEWNVYQNVYDRDYEATIPAETEMVEMKIVDGDWMTIKEIGLLSEAVESESVVRLTSQWNQDSTVFCYLETGDSAVIQGGDVKDRAWLKNRMEPWKKLQELGCGVMVGEFGAFSPAPHDVVLRWMEDMLFNWKEAGWGFALWNFRGAFGILDSGRTDIAYEDFHGHKLDRKMLELLKRY